MGKSILGLKFEPYSRPSMPKEPKNEYIARNAVEL
jgi:hypothetical protein